LNTIDGTVEWKEKQPIGWGSSPSIALNSNYEVIEAHEQNQMIITSIGKLHGLSVSWN